MVFSSRQRVLCSPRKPVDLLLVCEEKREGGSGAEMVIGAPQSGRACPSLHSELYFQGRVFLLEQRECTSHARLSPPKADRYRGHRARCRRSPSRRESQAVGTERAFPRQECHTGPSHRHRPHAYPSSHRLAQVRGPIDSFNYRAGLTSSVGAVTGVEMSFVKGQMGKRVIGDQENISTCSSISSSGPSDSWRWH
jgi:hypothetical protein